MTNEELKDKATQALKQAIPVLTSFDVWMEFADIPDGTIDIDFRDKDSVGYGLRVSVDMVKNCSIGALAAEIRKLAGAF